MDYNDAKREVYNILINTLHEQMKDLIFTERDRVVYRALTQYFNMEIEGENKFPKDLNKGICLFGGVGTGKTLTMKIFQQFTRENSNRFKIFDMKEIARDVQKNGIDILEEYTRGNCCYEDVGFEKPVQHYGSKWDVFEEIVNIMYEKGKVFHFTTNLAFNQDLGYGTLAERYDRRVVDRLNEMVNVIGLDGDSKRK
jgi:DNA replication protein DnaC